MQQWFDWSDEDVDDHVLGSGAIGTYPWYLAIDEPKPESGTYVARMQDPDGEPGQVKTYRFTRDDFRRIAQEIADGKHDVSPRYREYIRIDDLDADTVDIIIQIATYGAIVFA